MFNLINERWIPVRRQHGTTIEYIAPWQITEGIDSGNPICEIASPRPDFDGALVQFLIGLVQTTMSPANEAEYMTMLITPPAPGVLKAAFESVAHAFELDGANGRFMQDRELTLDHFAKKGKKSEPIAGLLLETRKPGKDLFVKSGTVKNLCKRCLAAALFTLQTNSPQGGAGHRTSLRGGGPLTTIIKGKNLWNTVCLNLLTSEVFYNEEYGNPEKLGDSDRFPWIAPTCVSKGSKTIQPADVNPVRVFWAMPRRLVIDYSQAETCTCDVCGEKTEDCVNRYFTEPYGENYDSGVWRHPLTPYYKDKKQWLPAHTRSTGRASVRYNALPMYVFGESELGRSAATVSEFSKRRDKLLSVDPRFYLNPHIWFFGYSMNIAAAECWYEGQMPLIIVEENIRADYESVVVELVKLAEYVINKTRYRIKRAGVANSALEVRFWQDTDAEFYNTLHALQKVLLQGGDKTEIKLNWLDYLSKIAFVMYDEYSQFNQIGGITYLKHIQDIADNRWQLRNDISLNDKTLGGKQVLKILDLTSEEAAKFRVTSEEVSKFREAEPSDREN